MTAPASIPPLLEARGIVKRFGPFAALTGVSLELGAGEILALCGENGAGKSTLIKTLSGIHPIGSFEGEIRIDGQPARFHGLADGQRAGISVIHQELALVEQMTVAENIFLGREPRRGFAIDWPRVYRESRGLLDRFGIALDPAAPVSALGVGQKQLIEIVKALAAQSRILILDEPTAALSHAETHALLEILRDLRRRGVGCIYVSHKLEEVFAIADRIAVLRDGQSIATWAAADTTPGRVIAAMVGREITAMFPRRKPPTLGPPRLEVEGLSVAPRRGRPARLRDIHLGVRAGEVLGVGGLMGAGRTELLMHLFGAWGSRVGGSVRINGRAVDNPTPRGCIQAGMALVGEDRKRYGLIMDKSIGFNLSLSSLGQLTRFGLIDQPREAQRNRRMFSDLRIKAPALETIVGRLSGGNQQKVILGKTLLAEPTVILLDEPTRGIDVGAKVEVYELINRLTDAGCAVVLVSSELLELMGMSDRIVMLSEGRIGGTFTREEATQENLLAAAIASHRDATVALPDSNTL